MDLVRLVEEKILLVVKEISKFFEGEVSYLSFEEKLKKTLDSLGLELLQLVLETLEEKIHESKERKRNARYFTKTKGKAEDLWWEVLDYLEARYDLAKVERIYLLGDGAPWIRAGLQYLPPQTIFILDKYHLEKYIQTATAHAPELRRLIYRGIDSLNKQAVLEHLYEALRRASEQPRRKRIIETVRYIKHNWDGIENGVRHPGIGWYPE